MGGHRAAPARGAGTAAPRTGAGTGRALTDPAPPSDTPAGGDGSGAPAPRPAPAEPGGFDPGWLALREPADHAARAEELVTALRTHLPAGARSGGPLVVRDLGSGTGSMARWLAPRLPGPQHWVLHDHDAALLAHAARATATLRDADGGAVEVSTCESDLTGLRAGDLAGAAVITASALLDLLTHHELDVLAAACAAAGCPALLTLSVAGRVELHPPADLDAHLAAAFDAHQRRTVAGRALLGPEAPATAEAAFRRHGMAVHTAASPWRLGPQHAELIGQWLGGWVAAAVEQDPELAEPAVAYVRRRVAAAAAGELDVTVHHRDLLAIPRGAST